MATPKHNTTNICDGVTGQKKAIIQVRTITAENIIGTEVGVEPSVTESLDIRF